MGDSESAPLWGGMRDELDTALRLCDHEIRKKTGGAAAAAADLARLGSDGVFAGPTDTAGGLLQVREGCMGMCFLHPKGGGGISRVGGGCVWSACLRAHGCLCVCVWGGGGAV